MSMLLECVPNISEGRRREVYTAVAMAADGVPGARLLHLHTDPDHNRSVLTLAGEPDALVEAVFRAATTAVERIDLRGHEGKHPRIGALDVVPFVPLAGADMTTAIRAARTLGARLGNDLHLPVFLYAKAAAGAHRCDLPEIRKPQFEGLRDRLGIDPAWRPDFGPNAIHPSAGCTAVGARDILIAYNIDLETDDVSLAREIARTIRERDGGFPDVRALGLWIDRRVCAQVSINVCDYRRTGLRDVFRAVERLASARGVEIRAGEIVGLCPRAALPEGTESEIRLADYSPDLILENRLQAVGLSAYPSGQDRRGCGAAGSDARRDDET